LQASNVWGGLNAENPANFDGKPAGLLSVNGKLYMAVTEQGSFFRQKICESTNHGATWNCTGWVFDYPGGMWSSMSFLQFGQDYQGARDNYVYVYTHMDGSSAPRNNILLGRVAKENVMDRNSYEFFTGLDGNNNPTWSSNINDSVPTFSDPNSVGFGRNIMYHPTLDRYILMSHHDEDGGWGIFDAPEPWGPWTTVAYFDAWLDTKFKFGFNIPLKWVSGSDFVMVFSGIGKYDDWNTVKGTFITEAIPEPTNPPQTPSGLSIIIQ